MSTLGVGSSGRRQLGAFALALCAFGLAPAAQAAGAPLDASSVQGKKVSIDGWLKEWAGFTRLSHTVKGSADGEPSASVAVAYDAKQLYLAFTIKDDQLVRSAGFGGSEDRLELSLHVPKPSGGFATYDLWIFPGVPGKSAGAVKLRGGGAVAGAKLVEASTKGGLDVEVALPWTALPATRQLRVGLRGVARYVDYDAGGKQKAIIATSDASGALASPPLRFENEQGLDKTLLGPKGLANVPDKAEYGNVAGDAALEQVAIYGGYLTILGGGYRAGKQFFYKDLGVRGASMVPRLTLADLNGDSRAEIILLRRVGASEQYREYLEVLSLNKQGEPFVLFEHETAIVTPEGKIQNRLSMGKHGGKPALVISQDVGEGWDQASFGESRQAEMPGALLPWEAVAERSFAWDGKAISQVAEKAGKPRLTSATPSAGGGTKAGPPPPPAPRPPTADELLDQVYALYRKSRNVGKQKPRFDFVTDVTGDTTGERVLVHGLDVVVFGKGYRGGTSFAYITLPAKAPEDLVHVTARDLTGDGKAEVVVRAKLKTKTSEEFGGVVVERHAILVYQVGEQALTRVFGAETGRQLGDKQVVGKLLFKPSPKGFELQLKAGQVVGWTKETYPFPVETAAGGGLEPLLLPWGSLTQLNYRFREGTFQRQ